ncbi:MAG TPA: tRNA (adenosine(37)-N6)-threonylcarbamoyltransferase complex transferase subunit TsaD [Patescibacteria group bacterium]|nr:tRNA (adenosine(37)-N6)-threonylcarbamoyltransferase complex transferase subunit TsaD [Patescibacteria group bacterium]
MTILSIDTSCDETAAALTDNTTVLSNIVWSQAADHAKFGGVMPSLAKRMHEERIDWVIEKALLSAGKKVGDINAVAVTTGPGLSIALGVGVEKAKEMAKKANVPLIPINHVEAHLLSPLSQPKPKNRNNKSKTVSKFPAFGLVVSGGNTIFVLLNGVGSYKVLAETQDDALGEALDKAARMLGLGYPGGAIFEKMAAKGNLNAFSLPVPLLGQENRQIFSYSGLKTSFYRLIESQKAKDPNFPSKTDTYNLAATFQNAAFTHIERVVSHIIKTKESSAGDFYLGGGVAANVELRKRLRAICRKHGLTFRVPYIKRLCGDNAAMVGVCAFLNPKFIDPEKIDRDPNVKLL